MQTELEKLDDGDEYCFFDEAVVTLKENVYIQTAFNSDII